MVTFNNNLLGYNVSYKFYHKGRARMSFESINLDSANNTQDFRLRYVSISKYEEDWQSIPHTHQFSELFYVLSGKGVFYIEDEIVPVETDDLMIINPHVEHTEKTLPNDPMEYIVFGVEGLAFSFDDPDSDNTKEYSYYSYGADKSQLINFAQLMVKEFRDKKPGFELVCHGLLQVLLVFISRKQHLNVISDTSFQLSKECALAKRYIDANYSKNITLDSLAEITHINKFYLAHSFTECMGQSPINYLTEVRLAASKQQLTTSNMSIAQIATNNGFSSQSYFSQIFKKKVGITPQQYRKRNSGIKHREP